jgi:hypothetical protein
MLVPLLATLSPQWDVVRSAYEHYGKAACVVGKLKMTSFGQSEEWTFAVLPKEQYFLETPYRVTSNRVGKSVTYYPFDRTRVDGNPGANGIAVITELWPFQNVGRGQSAGFGQPKETPRKATFKAKPCWALAGVPVPSNGKATLYFDATTGAFEGWREAWTNPKWSRQFEIQKLEWSNPKAIPNRAIPAGKTALPDQGSYLAIGKPFPDANLITEKGGRGRLLSLTKGSKGSMVTIGYIGCGPCEEVKKFVQSRYKDFRSAGIAFIPLETGATQKTLGELVKGRPLPFETYMSAGEDDFNARYRVIKAPTLYFLDGKGRVVYNCRGFDKAEIARGLKRIGM